MANRSASCPCQLLLPPASACSCLFHPGARSAPRVVLPTGQKAILCQEEKHREKNAGITWLRRLSADGCQRFYVFKRRGPKPLGVCRTVVSASPRPVHYDAVLKFKFWSTDAHSRSMPRAAGAMSRLSPAPNTKSEFATLCRIAWPSLCRSMVLTPSTRDARPPGMRVSG